MADAPTTLAGLLQAQAEAFGDQPFVHFEDRIVSFRDLNRQVNRAANGLAALGVTEIRFTSLYEYRNVKRRRVLSRHAVGLAIDVLIHRVERRVSHWQAAER